jgi:hypothetical protein
MKFKVSLKNWNSDPFFKCLLLPENWSNKRGQICEIMSG